MARDDRDLARECRLGDRRAYTELMRRHRRMVYAVVHAILGCTEDVEDVAQEAFVRAYRSIHRYSPRYAFSTWIRKIAVNCAANRVRADQRRKRREMKADAPGPAPVGEPADGRLRTAVEALPLKQRLAVTLFHLDEMTLAETAEAMGCSVGAVKSHLHRARRKLAKALADGEHG